MVGVYIIWIWYASIMLGYAYHVAWNIVENVVPLQSHPFEHPTNSVSVIGEEKPYTQEAGSINLYRNISKWTQFPILK